MTPPTDDFDAHDDSDHDDGYDTDDGHDDGYDDSDPDDGHDTDDGHDETDIDTDDGHDETDIDTDDGIRHDGARHEGDDLEVPAALATLVRQVAADVPATDHDLGQVRRRARRQRRRRSTGRGVLGVAAAAAVLLGAIGVVHRQGGTDESDVRSPGAPVPGERPHPGQGDAALLAPTAPMPPGWAPTDLSFSPYGRQLSMATTSQLFAVDGTPPLPRGVVVESWVEPDELEPEEGNGTVRGQSAVLEPYEPAWAGPATLQARWVEGGVAHRAIATGLSRTELVAFLDALDPHGDTSTGFAAPAGAALPELDTVTVEDPYFAMLAYEGPGEQRIELTAQYPGWDGGLLHRLAGRPRGTDLVLTTPGGPSPSVSVARADGWTVDANATQGSPDPALLDAMADSAEPFTMQEVLDGGLLGPVTLREAVGDRIVEVVGRDGTNLLLCLSSETGDQVCTAAHGSIAPGFSSAAFAVDGQWFIVEVGPGDESGKAFRRPRHPDPDEMDIDYDHDPTLDGERVEADGHVVEVVTVPDDVEVVEVMSPMGDDGTWGVSYLRPGGSDGPFSTDG
jgi:hypothetical protein